MCFYLLPKLEEIKYHLCQSYSPNILGLCETFLHADINDNMLQVKNYRFERKDREHKKGGGILVYVNNNIQYRRRLDLEVTDIESIWLEINGLYCKSFLINFIYRPPNSHQTWIDLYDKQLEIADSSNIGFHLIGDFNINYSPESGKYNNTKWADLTTKYGLEQLIKSPTRISKNNSTLIDHLYTNMINHVTEWCVSHLSLSDHFPVCFTHSITDKLPKYAPNSHTVIQYRSFKKFEKEAFQAELMFSGLDEIDSLSNSNDALKRFYEILNGILSKHAPVKDKRVKRENQPDWFTEEIISIINHRDKCRKTGNIDQYKILRNKVTSMIKKSKKNFFNNAIKDNKNPTYLWKNLKDISHLNQSTVTTLPHKMTFNEFPVEDPLNIVNELNSHFVSISNIITKTTFSNTNFRNLKHILDGKLGTNRFEIKHITPYEVHTIIDKLNVGKATGIDGVGPRILKQCGDTITPCIASIINSSIAQ